MQWCSWKCVNGMLLFRIKHYYLVQEFTESHAELWYYNTDQWFSIFFYLVSLSIILPTFPKTAGGVWGGDENAAQTIDEHWLLPG